MKDSAGHRIPHFRKYPIGDSCLCWSMAKDIDPHISRIILRVYRFLKNELAAFRGFRDIVPSYTALAVHYDPLETHLDDLTESVERVIISAFLEDDGSGTPDIASKLIRLKVDYQGEDLARVAEFAGLSIRDVVERHKAPCYTVAMMGFIPHFPYLLGLDARLETPRLLTPRTRVPAGAVAIGGVQAGVYPSESPGGWNIIGLTDPGPLAGLEPGDRVIFHEDMDA